MRSTINVSLPESMRDYVNEQVLRRGYGSVSEYFRYLVRKEQEQEHKLRIEAQIGRWVAEGIDPGPPEGVSETQWQEILDKVRTKLRSAIQSAINSGPPQSLNVEDIKNRGRQRMNEKSVT